MLRPLSLVAAVALVVACGGPTGEPVPDLTRPPSTITLVSGGDQTVVAGDTLAQPLRIRLTDSLGAPVAHWDVQVTWDSLTPDRAKNTAGAAPM